MVDFCLPIFLIEKFQCFRENLIFRRGNGRFLFGFGLGGEESRSDVGEVGFVMD
jgi:hypothetical protein